MSWKRLNQSTSLGGLGELWSLLRKGYKLCKSHKNEKRKLCLLCLNCPFRYYTITDEVLTSVKRTEESLLKLKQSRKSSTLMADVSSGMSDDNKIRLQLAMDIKQYLQKVSGNKIACSGIVVNLSVRITLTFLPTETCFRSHPYLILI